VGARPPGAQFATLISYAHDFDLYREWAKLMVFDRFDPSPRRFAVGAAYLRGQGPGDRVKAIHGIAEAQKEVGDPSSRRAPQAGQSPSGTYEVRDMSSSVIPRPRSWSAGSSGWWAYLRGAGLAAC
jgi:hypothetical protein